MDPAAGAAATARGFSPAADLAGPVKSLGVAVPKQDAEAARRALMDQGLLRTDLRVRKEGDQVVFPVLSDPDGFAAQESSFEPLGDRPGRYRSLLPWSEADRAAAPRAYDRLGDIVLIKVPERFWDRRHEVGAALLAFHPNVRAAFHDRGVVGPFRIRDLERIGGTGGSATTVQENGVRLHVDPAAAYFSPRLADERARIVAQLRPGQRVVDLFGGVGPAAVQAAKAGAEVVMMDLNPAACALARENATANGVEMTVVEGDARAAAKALGPADHVLMNLPHGAKEFLDTALAVTRPGGAIHYHEILRDDAVAARQEALVAEAARLGRTLRIARSRHVRDYATNESHHVFDLEVLD